jgi:hypothetical protein
VDPSSNIGTLAWAAIACGGLIALISFKPLHSSWSKRAKRIHGLFYHPDELKKEELVTEVIKPTTLLDQIDPHGFDASIYKERPLERDPK